MRKEITEIRANNWGCIAGEQNGGGGGSSKKKSEDVTGFESPHPNFAYDYTASEITYTVSGGGVELLARPFTPVPYAAASLCKVVFSLSVMFGGVVGGVCLVVIYTNSLSMYACGRCPGAKVGGIWFGDVGGTSIPAPASSIAVPGETLGPTSGLPWSPEGVATL